MGEKKVERILKEIEDLKKELEEIKEKSRDLENDARILIWRLENNITAPVENIHPNPIIKTEKGLINLEQMMIQPKGSKEWVYIPDNEEYLDYFLDNLYKFLEEYYRRAVKILKEEIRKELTKAEKAKKVIEKLSQYKGFL